MEIEYKGWLVYETASGFVLVSPRGTETVLGDGVDMFFTASGRPISPGTKRFYQELKWWLRDIVDSGDAEEAFGP